jgi:hypothetical protein
MDEVKRLCEEPFLFYVVDLKIAVWRYTDRGRLLELFIEEAERCILLWLYRTEIYACNVC